MHLQISFFCMFGCFNQVGGEMAALNSHDVDENSISESRADKIEHQYTPPKINMEPKNGGLEDDFPFQLGDFQVPC